MPEPTSDWSTSYFFLLTATIAVGLWMETRWPRSPLHHPIRVRWRANGALFLVNQLVLRALIPITVVAAAWWAQRRGWGLLNGVDVSPTVAFVVSFLAIDVASYGFHRLAHWHPWLWRIHRLHHSDPDVDVTTGFRFHPLESLCQVGVSIGVVAAVGATPAAAMTYLLTLAVVSMMSHANVRLPQWLDATLRLLVITPHMHRVHHSEVPRDYNSNYCTCLTLWDRMFGSYRSVPSVAFERMQFGVAGRSPARATAVLKMLADPFVADKDADPRHEIQQ